MSLFYEGFWSILLDTNAKRPFELELSENLSTKLLFAGLFLIIIWSHTRREVLNQSQKKSFLLCCLSLNKRSLVTNVCNGPWAIWHLGGLVYTGARSVLVFERELSKKIQINRKNRKGSLLLYTHNDGCNASSSSSTGYYLRWIWQTIYNFERTR